MRQALISPRTGHIDAVYEDGEGPRPLPGAHAALVDDPGGKARTGGTWDGAEFHDPPPAPPRPSDADIAEAEIRSSKALLGLARHLLDDDSLAEDDLVRIVRARLD